MHCPDCYSRPEYLGRSLYCRERALIYLCKECNKTLIQTEKRNIFRDFWRLMTGKLLIDDIPYVFKCKRIRDGEPTPCWCCIGECWGDKLDKEKA